MPINQFFISTQAYVYAKFFNFFKLEDFVFKAKTKIVKNWPFLFFKKEQNFLKSDYLFSMLNTN
jgi:hypothetical protein